MPTQIDFDNTHEEDGKFYYLCWHQHSQVSDDGEWKHCEIFQYTSRKDKHEKKIYEGDVVCSETSRGVRQWLIKYRYGGFGIGVDSDYCEIVGNIKENPELISNEHFKL